MSNINTVIKTDTETQTEIIKKKKGRSRIYTPEEAVELRKERNRIYQKNRYHNDPDFRKKKIERSAINNPRQYEKIKEKLQKLKDLEAMLELDKN